MIDRTRNQTGRCAGRPAAWRRMFSMLLLLLGLLPAAMAQRPGPPVNGANIVPNPGFERFNGKPERWFYRGEDLRLGPKYWFSATTASPDAYGPGIKVPQDWAVKGFGNQKPHRGKGMAGITVYGCTNGKPHCREYLEVQLAEPLVTGQFYYVEFWVTPLRQSLLIDQIGAYFSVSPIERGTDEILVREAQVRADSILAPGKAGEWLRVNGTFEARYEAEHILIGNFSDDAHTRSRTWQEDGYNYAYYYIDDVVVRKIPPFLAVPVKPDDLTKITPEKGKTFRLKDIYFEFDRSELMPRSYVELHKLYQILRRYPAMTIEIIGHTDAFGSDEYKLSLSLRRAQAVVDYLVQNGIPAGRLKVRGAGEQQPAAGNDTPEGRALNRRVEFLVLKM
jgi:OmpA-OmpF porin, OOP family